MTRLLALLFCLAACGCKVLPPPPTAQEVADAPIGVCPSQADAEMAAKELLDKTLKDPMSAVTTFEPIGRSYYSISYSGTWSFAWRLQASVNAKNGYGGYTGAREWDFFFRGGNVMVAVATPETTPYGHVYMNIVALAPPIQFYGSPVGQGPTAKYGQPAAP